MLRLVVASVLLAASAAAEPLPSPLDDVAGHTAAAFGGWTWLYAAGAVTSTAALSASGGDHTLRVAVQEAVDAPAVGTIADYTGYLMPTLVAPGVYVAGLIASDADIAGAGSAAVQALVLTIATTAVLKIGTGRPFPLHGGDPAAPDRLDHPEYGHEWRPFGFGGRYAWPSGHTAAMMSVAAALTAHDPSVIAVPLVAYPLALGVGAGMLVGDHHWASDVLAGGLLGQAIGWSVGRSFVTGAGEGPGLGVRWVPLLGETRGLALVGVL